MKRRPLRRLWQDERGQSVTSEFLLVILLIVLFLGIAMFLTKVRPAQVTVTAAARACARQAEASLSQPRSLAQAESAARIALMAGHLNPSRGQVIVTPLGPWDRFAQVSCEVRYTVDLRAVPLLQVFAPSPDLELRSSYTVSLDRHKSRWE
jgi:hypothetical protein